MHYLNQNAPIDDSADDDTDDDDDDGRLELFLSSCISVVSCICFMFAVFMSLEFMVACC